MAAEGADQPEEEAEALADAPDSLPLAGAGEDWRSETADLAQVYLNEVGRKPLLTQAEEQYLARLARDGDDDARRQMIERNLRLVVSVVKRYQGRGVDFLDLIEEGNLGLMHALEKFDPDLGYRFSTYAVWWIRQNVERALLNQSRTVRLPVHVGKQLARLLRAAREHERRHAREASMPELSRALSLDEAEVAELLTLQKGCVSFETPIAGQSELTLADMLPDPHARGPEGLLGARQLDEGMGRWLSALSPRHRAIIELRYGLGDEAPLTLEAVGARLGISRERVRQSQIEALEALRRQLRREGLDASLLS
ncbi:sigma-70 family RNA polymerase sigma factor [Crenobacter caeni]|uniref:Sigma-70 family RNA polymerase sigma factor n=1 Tax=Crenobacter caeni TaxID=2705474 RepID=A0A6B2KR64_9NEIS|nr:sigma-70 family RNA polymerase sigma factor [Crenobacter caeni]